MKKFRLLNILFQLYLVGSVVFLAYAVFAFGSTGMIEKERRLGLLIPTFAIMGLMLAAEGPFESNLLYAAVPPLAALLRRFS